MAENALTFIKNKTRTGHFGWPATMEIPHSLDQTPLQKRIVDSTVVTGHSMYVGPGEDFLDDKNLLRCIMSDPASWTVWFTDRQEIRALGVPDGKVFKDLDAEGKEIETFMDVIVDGEVKSVRVWGVPGANLVLRDVTKEQRDLVEKTGGRIAAVQNVKSLEKNLAKARAEAAEKDAEIAALKKRLEAKEEFDAQQATKAKPQK